jgi:glycerophosphoryl diester phosphodiesterase
MSRTSVIAHRGVAHGSTENTLESFRAAIDVGADMIEFDVRKVHGGEMIAFHDSQIRGVQLTELTRSQIAEATGAQPALFSEIIELCTGKIKLDIELKEDGYVDEVVSIIKAGAMLDQIMITSFLPAALVQAKKLLPVVKTGLILGAESPKPYLRTRIDELFPIDLARKIEVDYIVPHHTLAKLGVLRRASAAGIPCFVWTVNSEKQIRTFAADRRIEGIITDEAALARKILMQMDDVP